MLLLTILGLFYVLMSSNGAVEQAEQEAQKAIVTREHPKLGALAEP
jgi:hypothetical protein